MKKAIIICVAMLVVISSLLTAGAAQGNVTYSGNSGQIIFAPGSDYSPTDLFPNFKSVMPGDSISQTITVRNNASNNVKVVIYMRSLGAHENSVEFLSKLGLRVEKTNDNEMGYMFDAYANETAQLTEWVKLGTLYSGGTVNLNVILDVPVTLGNEFSDNMGYLDWEFMIEEYPVEPEDPKPPQTGDDFNLGLWSAVLVCSAVAFIIILIWRRKNKKEENEEDNRENNN